MKRKKIILLTTLLLLILTGTVFTLLYKNSKSETSININVAENKPIMKNLGSLNIMVDPRIELLSAVQLNSEYESLTELAFSYRNDMEHYFENDKDHIAVSTFQKLRISGYSYDAPPTSMLFLSNPPSLEQKIDFDNEIIGRAGNKRNLTNFVQYLRKFSSDANFNNFYEKNLPLYQTLVDKVYNNIKELEITKVLDDYYGMKVNSYNLILAPMLHSGGYGPKIKGENGLYDVYAIIGPSSTITENGEIIPDFSIDTINHLVWHEFSHSFVNPTTDQYTDEIDKYTNLFDPIRDQMELQAYSEWKICVNEHIVRAITTRLAYIHSGQAAGDQALAYEKNHGFYYIEALCDSLKTYEENRDIYPTFESYYKELIKVFQKLSEQDIQ